MQQADYMRVVYCSHLAAVKYQVEVFLIVMRIKVPRNFEHLLKYEFDIKSVPNLALNLTVVFQISE